MQDTAAVQDARTTRVDIPVLVSFSASAFTIREFTLNLSAGGIFLPTDRTVPVGARGSLKFCVSQFDTPFIVEAEVVRIVEPGGKDPAGLGIKFIDLTERDRERLDQMVDGGGGGSVVESIRRAAREGKGNLERELRKRPVGQKLMLAAHAQGPEIGVLIREGNPVIHLRLLESARRLNTNHILTILRQKTLPTRVLSAIRRDPCWLSHDDARLLFCSHPRVAYLEAVEEMNKLTPDRLRKLADDIFANSRVKMAAKTLIARQRSG